MLYAACDPARYALLGAEPSHRSAGWCFGASQRERLALPGPS
jgi:hypothetical protein